MSEQHNHFDGKNGLNGKNGTRPLGPSVGSEFVLYVDESRDSMEATRLLTEAKLSFRTESAIGEYNLPWLEVGNVTLKTLAGVESIVRGFAPLAVERYASGDTP